MSDPAKCPRCGGDLRSIAPDGQCIGCLLELGFDAAEPDVAALPSGPSPVSAEVREPIGPYRLVRIIGEGRCGIVWLVEQDQPIRRRLALKIAKLGMNSKAVMERFEAERQALATTDHPNIVKVFDAGATAAGCPYFLMELVPGAKIMHYCEARRLALRARLELFLQICLAVQHVHQKGLVHCNIRSSNILVTEDGNNPLPKIINLGLAGSIADEALTRADVYSLGVLLYELLTGRPPHEGLRNGLDEPSRPVPAKEVLPPSARLAALAGPELEAEAERRQTDRGSLLRQTRGALDWIVTQALKSDHDRRYDSAAALMNDVRRFLNHEPVRAAPSGFLYPTRKWMRRHKLLFGTGVAVAAVVLFGVAAVMICYRTYYASLRSQESAEKKVSDSRLADEMWRQKQIPLRAALKAQFGIAQRFDAAGDFSITNGNPNGAWAYSDSSDWQFLDRNLPAHAHAGWYDQWSAPNANSRTPLVRYNFSNAQHEQCPPGGLMVHAGSGGYVHLVWTAPQDGLYWVSSRFDILWDGSVDAFVADRAGGSIRLASATLEKSSPAFLFAANLCLQKGEQLDFGVGLDRQDASDKDGTGLSITIERYGVKGRLPAPKEK